MRLSESIGKIRRLSSAMAAALLFCQAAAFAAEADHYTVPDNEVADITYELNSRANELASAALRRLELEGACTDRGAEEQLYGALRRVFSRHGSGALVDEILDGELRRTVIPLKASVYRDWDLTSGIFLARSQLTLSPLIKLGGLVIGVDKLEHMFGSGFRYYQLRYLEDMPLKRVLALGAAAEKLYLGGNVLETGVFSFGDQSANFNGMRFWNHVLQKGDDVLGRQYNFGPYVLCRDGRWEMNPRRPVDLSRYMDRSLQENYNCSRFATQAGLNKFNAMLAELGKGGGDSAPLRCPVSAEALQEAGRKYEVPLGGGRTIADWVINPAGNATVEYLGD